MANKLKTEMLIQIVEVQFERKKKKKKKKKTLLRYDMSVQQRLRFLAF